MVNQVSTILLRSFQTVYHQKSNMVCNIITPIMCLFFIWIVKTIVQEEIKKTRFSVKLDIPIVFNVPFYNKLKYSNLTAKTSSCQEWYLYDFEDRDNNDTRNFFEEMLNSSENLKSLCDDNPENFSFSPYFQDIQNVTILDNETDINSYLYDRAFELNYIDIESLFTGKPLTKVPDGAITIKKLDFKNFEYKMQINDLRLTFYHRANGVTLFYIYNSVNGAQKFESYPSSLIGMMWALGLYNRAYINKLYPNLTIISGLQLMPIRLDDNENNIQRVINIVGTLFYPISVSLLMPLFMYNIVIEKERQLIEIMKINGLKIRNYWISYFIFNYIIYAITMICFIIFGTYVFGLNLFRETSPLLIFLTLVIWGFCQISLAFFFQAFLSNGRTTSIIGYMIALWIIIICTCLNLAMFVIPKEAPYILNIFPSFGVSRIFYYMATYCGYETCIDDFSKVNSEVRYALVYMLIGGFIFLFFGVYLYEVLPKQYGIRKGPFFCIEEIIKKIKKNKYDINESNDIKNIKENDDDKISNIDDYNINNSYSSSKRNSYNSVDMRESLLENNDNYTNIINTSNNNNIINNSNTPDSQITSKDEEVVKENIIVQDLIEKGVSELIKYPLVCKDLSKIYPSNLKSKDPKKRNKKSLDDFTISLKDNEIFGLLGPNGAGKTTFFSILTGIYEPTSGDAFIRGNSILKNIEKTYQYIGYCPQFDLLWEDLSVENTLLFYSRMKNKEKEKINFMVEKILEDVKLTKFRKYLVRELSGGMRRRLTLGVALIGEPPIVFLDEPTTGLDPKNKREIWDILSHCKANRCMILTTHLMDEAETLCDRIGIILKGKIRCLGSQYKLKTNYGKGFKLCINLKPYTIENKRMDSFDEDTIIKKNKKIGFFFDKNKIKEQNRINKIRIDKLSKFLNEIFDKNCTLVEKHRGAAIFEIGKDVFNPELLFKKLEEKKEELEITNWAISQVDLEDIFIKLTENDL